MDGIGPVAPIEFDGEFDIKLASLLKRQRALDVLPLLERLLQSHQHDVKRGRRQRHRLSRLDFEPTRYRTHFCDPTHHLHAMDFEAVDARN